MRNETALNHVMRAIAKKHRRENWQSASIADGTGELEWVKSYGEPGYTDPEAGILLANWNHVPRKLCDYLESLGFELEWSDEWIVSFETNKCYRSSPDSHGWKPYFVLTESGDVIGGDEIENGDCADEYLELLINNPQRANVFSGFDLAAHGFAKFNGEFETGFHPGQDDKPADVLAKIQREKPDHDVVFQLDNVGQFDMCWTAWIRPQDDN